LIFFFLLFATLFLVIFSLYRLPFSLKAFVGFWACVGFWPLEFVFWENLLLSLTLLLNYVAKS
jgi:hypothetical protein